MNESDIPGFGPLAVTAAATHSLFLAYVDAGFKREEALRIIIGIMASMTAPQVQK